MKKFLILFILFSMLACSVGSAAFWDIQKMLTGRQMIVYGAPWVADNQPMYFGTDRDVSIKYNTTSGVGEVVGLAAVSNLSIEMASGEDITFAGGDSKMDLSAGSGIFKPPTGAITLGPGDITMSGDLTGATKKNITLSGAGGGIVSAVTITGSGTVGGADLTASDDLIVTDDGTFDGKVRIDETLTVNAIVDNTTLAVTGLTSTNGGLATGVNASTVLSTTLTSASTKTVYDVDASGANRTLTLPDAATVDGRMYFISVAGNPGNNYVRITATGGDDINANNYLVSTDQWSTAIVVASNGAYRALTSGTWAAHA